MMITAEPPGSSRVYAVERNQSHCWSRIVSEFASCQFLIGSSISSRSAPLPVSGPPTPAVDMPPPAFVIQFEAAVTSWRIDVLKNRFPCASRISRAFLPCDSANVAS